MEKEEIIEESQKWVRKNKGTVIKSQSYQSPRLSSEVPDCSMPMTFDHYNYCSLGCLYCFAYFLKSNNPSIKKIELKSVNVKNLKRDITGNGSNLCSRAMYEHFYSKKFLLHWGGLADPFCAFEKKNRTGLELIEFLGEQNYPTLFSFKGDGIFEKDYVNIFERYSEQKNFAFQVSIITSNEELAKQIEFGVPSPTKRIEAINMLSSMGYWTILRLRPFIIGISEHGLKSLLERSLKAGIKGVSVEFMAIDRHCSAGMFKRYDWIAEQIGLKGTSLQKYFKILSPSERGGYMRLNRKVKEPYVKMIYKFCADNGLVCGVSDPDFKELNTSGSCCGMPDHHPENPLLENWTRDQLTYHIKEARKKYHTEGGEVYLTFDSVYGKESTYLDENTFVDFLRKIQMGNSIKRTATIRKILQEQWNNFNSPANPRNYFHGKLMPVGADENDNIIYVYNPMEYETSWKKEKIDLTR